MGKLEDIISRARDIDQKIKELFSEEQEIKKGESAELQKIKKLRKDINASKDGKDFEKAEKEDGKIPEDVKKDFVEAIDLFDIISEELDQSSKELESIVSELNKNSVDELEIIEGLSSGELEIHESSKIKRFTQSLNKNRVNTERTSEELEELEKEAKQAQKEAEKLVQMDKVLNNINSLEEPEEELKNSIRTLEEVEGIIPDISTKLNQIENRESQTFHKLEENSNINRRTFMKGTLGASALLGLSGCMSPEVREMWGVDDIGSESEAERMHEIENKESQNGMNPFIRTEKAERVNLDGKSEEIMELVLEADEDTTHALQIHNSHSTEELPSGEEIKQMRKLFQSAIEHYKEAELLTEQKNSEKAEEMINYLEMINELYYEGIDNLLMSYSSTREGADEDAKEKLRKYQDKFLEAINTLEEKGHISEYELKQTLAED